MAASPGAREKIDMRDRRGSEARSVTDRPDCFNDPDKEANAALPGAGAVTEGSPVPFVTLVIPCYNEARHIQTCLDSVTGMDYPKDRWEVLVVDGGSADGTREAIATCSARHPWIRLVDNPERIVPYALNRGVRSARGAYIIRLDAHARYPTDYVSKLVSWAERLGADNVGAVGRTDVLAVTRTSIAITKVLAHRLGVGNSLFRVGVSEPTRADTVPFGCFRRSVFDRIGLFDERLIRNQDVELNKRLLRSGGTIYLLPDVECTYLARENFVSFARNQFRNGLWNLLTIFYTGNVRSISPRHLVPLAFVLTLLLSFAGALIHPLIGLPGIVVLGVYAAAVLAAARGLRDTRTTPFHVAAAFAVLHFSYALGSLVGAGRVAGLALRGRRSGGKKSPARAA